MSPTAAPRRVALLFPGQGSHTRDMRVAVERFCPELAELAIEAIGEDPFARAGDSTAHAQPAIFCASVAGWRSLVGVVQPSVVVGHSLGEFAALVAADVLEPATALRLVIERGRLMQRAHERAAGGWSPCAAMISAACRRSRSASGW